MHSFRLSPVQNGGLGHSPSAARGSPEHRDAHKLGEDRERLDQRTSGQRQRQPQNSAPAPGVADSREYPFALRALPPSDGGQNSRTVSRGRALVALRALSISASLRCRSGGRVSRSSGCPATGPGARKAVVPISTGSRRAHKRLGGARWISRRVRLRGEPRAFCGGSSRAGQTQDAVDEPTRLLKGHTEQDLHR